jgi:hypothetical protein
VNLFSISKELKSGFDLSNKELMISSKKGSVSVTFDRIIKTVNGSVSGIKIARYDPSVDYYLEISSIEDESYGSYNFWALVVDDHTYYRWI